MVAQLLPPVVSIILPQNADTEKLKRTGVAFSDIKNTLASLAGKAVLFVDTCHSGNVMGTRRGVADINAVVNELASTEKGTFSQHQLSFCQSSLHKSSIFGGHDMKRIILAVILACMTATTLHAGQSVIAEGEGYACMGDDKSRKVTESAATADAKRNAAESAVTLIKSETHVKDAMLEKDLLSAYTKAQVRVVQEMIKEWYKDQGLGDCYRVKLKVEVVPDGKAMVGLSKRDRDELESDPAAPLSVRIWTDRKEYGASEKMRVYLKGNKPFYGKVVYKQADGSVVQLLPNPYRKQHYFNGGVVYELPSGEDRFDMEVTAPFGSETLTLYASTAPTGNLDVRPSGPVFSVTNHAADVPLATRGIKLTRKGEGMGQAAAEFAEAGVTVATKAGH